VWETLFRRSGTTLAEPQFHLCGACHRAVYETCMSLREFGGQVRGQEQLSLGAEAEKVGNEKG
jgi:predicted PP-loop superfamily ATPase